MKLLLFFYVVYVVCQVDSDSFKYEKMHNYGLGRRVIQNYRRHLFDKQNYPKDLPSPSTSGYIRSPYHNIYQGIRRRGDKRVYNNNFDHAENNLGQKVFIRGDFPCIINHVLVESEDGIPTLLRGGVGYRSFDVAVRAPPDTALRGRVRAYCFNYTEFEADVL